ncbi:MAG: histidine kinase [Lachnospiraceae bacterium]|nr:histidine kinase [Lachnospiraceae bacterium]
MAQRKKARTRRLGPKLIRTVFLIVTLGFVIFFCIVAAELYRGSREREIDNQRSQLTQTAGRIRSLQSTIRNIASLIVYNDVVQKGISGKAEDIGDELYAARNISNTLKEYLHIVDGTEEITIYTTDGQTLTSRYVRGNMDPAETDWFRDFRGTGKTSGFTGVHSSIPMQSGYTTDVFTFITGYFSLDDPRDKLGELLINVEYRTLRNMTGIDMTMLNGYALFSGEGEKLVEEGELPCSYEEILGGMKDGLYRPGGGEIYVVSDQMDDGWILISRISGKELLQRFLSTFVPIFGSFAVMLLVLGVLLSHMIRRITDPINALSEAAEAVGHGDFSVSVDIHTQDEIEDLAKAFNRMVVDINDLMNESVAHEKKIQQMQTENLMLQINPHFIYNTMNSIVYMARMDGNQQIADFTNAFISLLQSTLRVRDSVYTTLGEELKNVRSYLFLQSYRYGNKFTWEIDCPEELEACRVICVMLQPVVENAIFHGIAPKDGPGQIRITAEKTTHDDMTQILLIEVSDDGVGMDAQTLSQILSEDYVHRGGVHKIGVGNVRARIREVYKDPYTLEITSLPGEGTQVVIEIPFELSDGEEPGNRK